MGTAERDLAQRVGAAEPEAISEALERVEDTREAARTDQRELLAALEAQTPGEHSIVGLTGPPGAGKSSLAAALIRELLGRSEGGVGMVAIDPSSARSRGALLGDRARIRMPAGAPVFVRSLAARDQLGGLAPAARAAAAVLRAAYPWTLVETVGVGQSEIQIASLADCVVLVLQPGSGDTLQFMKAGILEIPDIFVVHKWDLGTLAERTRDDLEAVLGLLRGAARPDSAATDWRAPVIGAASRTGVGVAELAGALERQREQSTRAGERTRRRGTARVTWALELFVQRYGTLGVERIGGRAAAERLAAEVPGSALDAFRALATRTALEPADDAATRAS